MNVTMARSSEVEPSLQANLAIEALLECGADPNIRDWHFKTPLDVAQAVGAHGAVAILLHPIWRNRAMVGGALSVHDPSGSKYTVYCVTVASNAGQMWTVHKRYSDYEQLHAQLGKSAGAISHSNAPRADPPETFQPTQHTRTASCLQAVV